MPKQDEMTIDEGRKYVKLMVVRYRKANHQERSRLLSVALLLTDRKIDLYN